MSPLQQPPTLSDSFSSASASASASWFFPYPKLRFFTRIRRFLRSKSLAKRSSPSARFEEETVIEGMGEEEESLGLQRSVKRLHFGSWEEKEVAAMEIRRLAQEDVKTRKSLAELGVVPPLVAMVGSPVVGRQRLAVQTLIELANGTYTNKALMVEAGLLSNLPQNTDTIDESTMHEFARLLLIETKESCICTLYNLSAVLDNSGPLVNGGVVQSLLRLVSVKEVSEKALATLGNLVVTMMGKKAVENSTLVPESLIEIMTWEDKPKCQELSAYILMILAHQSSVQRQKMAKAGIVPVLLEVALLGSPLAQKRVLKLLQWFKDERQTRMGPHSGPQAGRYVMGSPVNQRETLEGKKLMKTMVKQSLNKNMEMITRRANAATAASTLKTLVISTSSKSLPY
ncbi:hypothetical protein CK203_097712 [Vitis vinifera]|uniref:U-box domain-containing protein 7 n=1 Tax=Vitis vinifera TaxID=29760 RepID=A0A438C6H4_VITVI|nr:hypothetical protein CK203_097712 [Vitis vinifera]